MIRTEDIHSLTEFRQNATAHLDRLATSGAAEVLTVNGQAKGVVMSPETFDELAAKAALVDSLAMLDRGMQDVKAGRGKDFRQAVRDIADDLGLELPDDLQR